MRLGLSISGHRPAPEAVRAARAAEERGFAEVWLTEDYCERGAFAVAGAVAAATERVAIGLGVLNPWTRHPVLTAMEFAALDELAEGRAVLGMGASNARWMQADLGIPFERPLSRLTEAVALLRAALSGQPVEHDGEAYRVHTGLSFPVPRPSPPIVLGVKGRRALEVAGRSADGVLLSVLSSPAYVSWAAERIGRPLPLSAYIAFSCDEDGEAARAALRPLVATFLGVHGDHDITRVAGLDPELAARFREGWMQGRPATDLVDDTLLDTFAVAGTPQECTAGLRRFLAAGLDGFVIRDDPHTDLDALLTRAAHCAHAARA